MHSRLVPCFRLRDWLVAVKYRFGRRWLPRGFNQRPILNGFGAVLAFRTIARAEVDGMPDSVTGEPTRDKMTAALAAAPTAQATDATKKA
jgi:hypothetical protein